MYIVHGEKAQGEDLVAGHEMAQVGPGESAAGLAAAAVVERARILAVGGVAEDDPSGCGERGGVSSHPGGGHAVEQVDAAGDALDEVLGEAHAHKVARAFPRD